MSGSLVHDLMNPENAKGILDRLGQDFLAVHFSDEPQIQTSESEIGSKVIQALASESKPVGEIHYIATAPLQLSELKGFFFVILYDSSTPQLI